jgi:heat shock protein HtpX
MKRIFLFLMTNIAILIVLSIVLSLFGFEGYMDAQGINLDIPALLVFCAVFGMGGSFISLAISKWMAKRSTGAQVIEEPANDTERWLVATVQRQAEQAGIGMPEVAIFPSPAPNAFATGMNRNKALVAVSAGLLNNMSRDEVEAVLGHEVAHVANGDMITLALIQGVLNAFVMFFARVIGHFVDRVILKNDRGHGIGYYVTMIAAELLLGVLAAIIVMWFSRKREFRADEGGANLSDRKKMISALEALQRASGAAEPLPDQLAAFGIAGGIGGGIKRLFMSHPPLEERIAALKANQ